MIFVASALVLLQTPLVDLVSNPANPGRPRPVLTMGGRSFHVPPPAHQKLPLEIKLESITPSPDRPTDRIVEVLIKNIGVRPYPLPVGRYGDLALKPKNRDRHEFWFVLRAPGERFPDLPGQATFSAADLPDSVLMIPPNAVVRVRFKADIGIKADEWNHAGRTEVRVQAGCEDHRFDDNPKEYLLHAPFPAAFSISESVVTLQ